MRAWKLGLAGLALAFAAGCGQATGDAPAPAGETAADPALHAAAQRIKADIAYLADDAREGREAGTPGYNAAALYVAEQFADIGLEPAGVNGAYFQSEPLLASVADIPAQRLEVSREGGARLSLTRLEDFLIMPSALFAESDVAAPAVFVGYGVSAPQAGYDDYAGVDVSGKIVVALSGAPRVLPSEERAHYNREKYAEASKRGAVAFITIPTEESDKVRPFSRLLKRAERRAMTWINPFDQPNSSAPGLKARAVMSADGAAKLFEGAPRSYAEIRAEAADSDAPLKGFSLGATVEVGQKTKHEKLESMNVVGVLEGSDPQLKSQYVVLSAHLDHLGVTPDVKGDDKINNGALDNAAGVATMLEAARMFKAAGTPPKRSIVFLALTAEEKGLLGSDYFARYPTVPREGIVADVNLDMPMLLYPFTDVVAFGAEHSSLGPLVADAAARMDVKLSPDPMPEEGIFTRSDHYNFVRQGVPSVFLMTGFANGGEKAFRDFLANHYHQPSDDLSQPIEYDQGARFARLNYLIAREIADAADKPKWNEGDFFGDLFTGKAAPGGAE